ncbi:MAG: nucleoside triphosphate pyrophosphohydrolase [Oscillospiraceae bacterium]|nr:nucleoside triphosphate pyrophosphohydrolase [Oscillospiraceae bacterium]
MMDNDLMNNKEKYDFGDLLRVMDALLAPDGCPWDREQTHESLKRYLIEEAYEVLEAIDAEDAAVMCEELGDVLLQIVFHAHIAADFDIGDVIEGVCKKMISRHPHVFGTVVANTPGEVLENWESIKRNEKGLTRHIQSLKGVPSNLPALMRAYKVQQKARDAGFDWDGVGPVLDKVEEELAELRRAIAASGSGGDGGSGSASGEGGSGGDNIDSDSSNNGGGEVGGSKSVEKDGDIYEELGDFLFAAVNLSRFIDAHPELALTASTEKFIRRFGAMEEMIDSEGLQMKDMSLAEMDTYWDKVKSAENRGDINT